jgi:siderophore synthetase component
MELGEVRRWARRRRISPSRFRQAHDGALLHAISRLLQAIHRESRVTRLSQDARGRWSLDIGRGPVLRAPVGGPLPYGRLETIALPWLVRRRKRRSLRTAEAFLAALRRCLAGSEYSAVFAALRADFRNSVANVVLNRLLGASLRKTACAVEPAYQGHHYYPFPALRRGPTLSQVLQCSNLSARPVALPLLEIDSLSVVCGAFADYAACVRAWSGLPAAESRGTLLPVHPWQLELSPLVRALLARRLVTLSKHTLRAVPLASQRTCRIVATGFDLKLPVDATITGEHRLLYRLNCENAPVISALAKRLPAGRIGFQEDVASIFHAERALAPHLSAIVRPPVRARAGEAIVPAINLWTGREEARRYLRPARIEEFFERYCAALMTGPVEFCSQWGMAFEPHLQNVYIAFRDGLPARIVLRDLDNTILDPRRARRLLRRHGLAVREDTWRAMPPFETGAKRLVQAMLFGHLGEVIRWLAGEHGTPPARLAAIVEDTWSALAAQAPTSASRREVRALRGWSDAVKATLRTRLHRSTTMQFIRE